MVVWCVWNVNFLARIPHRRHRARQNFGQVRHAEMFGMKETLQESILYGTKVTGVNQIWKNNAKARSIYMAYIGTEGTWSM